MFKEFSRLVHQHTCPDACASEIRSQLNWWMGAFAAAFTEDLSRVLMVKLGDYAKSSDGLFPWTLPGGSVELGEPPTTAVRREIEEETGLAIKSQLTPIAWMARPYYQSRRLDSKGEFVLLLANQ